MEKNLELFDKKLGEMFPCCKDIVADIKDPEVIIKFLKMLLGADSEVNAIFSSGEISKNPEALLRDNGHLLLVDKADRVAYRFKQPLKMLVARFPEHPRNSFVMLNFSGADTTDVKKMRLSIQGQNKADLDLIISIKNKGSNGGFLLYPLGSLFNDQRIQKQVRELASRGRESTLFSELLSIDGDSTGGSPKAVKLVDYSPEDAVLWEKWQKNIDTSIFQTNIRPKSFTAAKAPSDEYKLKMVEYGGKKVGAVWVEQIVPRIASAEMGLLIGEPHLWGLGIGSRAMQAMMEYAKKELKLKFLWLSVREANKPALACYKKCGFIIKKRTPVVNKVDGSYQIWVTMERML